MDNDSFHILMDLYSSDDYIFKNSFALNNKINN